MNKSLKEFCEWAAIKMPGAKIHFIDEETDVIATNIPVKKPDGTMTRVEFASGLKASLANQEEYENRFCRLYAGMGQSSDLMYTTEHNHIALEQSLFLVQ